jgi:ligand-binding SRPBCC domain-containing protein
MIFTFQTEQLLNTDLDTAWTFFSSPKNLAIITPPELEFKIHTHLDKQEIFEGMIIDYTVKPLFGIPLKWRTEISEVVKPEHFIDQQLKGPYRRWEHTHKFRVHDQGVFMQDEVNYELPFGILGILANRLVVRNKIEQIFKFREATLKRLFK